MPHGSFYFFMTKTERIWTCDWLGGKKNLQTYSDVYLGKTKHFETESVNNCYFHAEQNVKCYPRESHVWLLNRRGLLQEIHLFH